MALTKVKGHIIADDLALGGNPTTSTQSTGNNTTRLATTAFVQTELAALVDSSPSALNTLNELAAALGDDANFSTTVNASITAKAPLANPNFTGQIQVSNAASTIQELTVTGNNTRSTLRLNSKDSSGNSVDLRMHSLGDGPRAEVFTYSNHDLAFATNNAAPQMTLKTDGKFGIGTQSPNTRLTVGSGSGTEVLTILAGTSGESQLRFADGTSGTAAYQGRVEYDHANSLLNLGAGGGTQVTIDSSGQVGIGTNSPAQLLEVRGNGGKSRFTRSGSTGTTMEFYAGASQSGGIQVQTTGLGISGTNGENQLFIKAGGNVGIGTDNPSALLHLKSTATGLTPSLIFENTNNAQNMNIDYWNNGGAVQSRIQYAEGPASWNFIPNTSTSNSALYIAYDSKVGIGTTSPDTKLHVFKATAGSITDYANNGLIVENSGDVGISMHTPNANAGHLMFGSPGNQYHSYIRGGYGASTTSTLKFYTDNINTMTHKAGKVGIGTDSPDALIHGHASSPQLRLTSSADSGTPVAQIGYAGGSGYFLRLGDAANNEDIMFRTYGNSFFNGGNVGVGETSPSKALHVNAGTAGGIMCEAAQDNTISLKTTSGGNKQWNIGNYYTTWQGLAAPFILQPVASSGSMDIALCAATNTPTTGIVIKASGNVGIGTTAPTALLHIDGATNSKAGITLEGNGNGDVIHLNFKTKANNGTLSYHGISASPGADQDDNTISFGNGAGNGVVVNHQNVVRTRYSEIHSGGTFAYDVGGNYLGANGAGFGTHAIFRTPSVSSPSSGAASTQFLTVYSSGHWGEFSIARFRLYTTYFNGGYREYLFRMVAGTANLSEVTAYSNNTSWGSAPGSITVGSVSDTGTDHSGQSIYKVDLTFASSSAYYRNYVVTEIGFGSNRYYGSGTSSSTLNSYTNGGKYHFKTISLAESRGKFTA